MRVWKFDNGISVEEGNYDGDLHCFWVYDGDTYLGTIYPDTIIDMEDCADAMDYGTDPITGGWQDGCGHNCTREGW